MTDLPYISRTKNTHTNNTEIEDRPETREIFLKSKSNPLHQHFYCKQSSKDNVHPEQGCNQCRFGVQGNIFKCLKSIQNSGVHGKGTASALKSYSPESNSYKCMDLNSGTVHRPPHSARVLVLFLESRIERD